MPFYRLSHRPGISYTRNQVLASPSAAALAAFPAAVFNMEVLASAVALSGVLAKFLPLLLQNIPFRLTESWRAHETCTWATVAVLAFMIVVLVAHRLAVKWPYMPAELNTMAGYMYYTLDSPILMMFAGFSSLSKRERRKRLAAMAKSFTFGKMVGVSGGTRIGVDCFENS